MGNRAVITWGNRDNYKDNLGVYLHWNGGIDWVTAFLKYCNLKGYREPDKDDYGYARFCQVVGNFFGGSTSVGINLCKYLDCDNKDNGVYLCEGWKVVGKLFEENYSDGITLFTALMAIDDSMPIDERLGKEVIMKEVQKNE